MLSQIVIMTSMGTIAQAFLWDQLGALVNVGIHMPCNRRQGPGLPECIWHDLRWMCLLPCSLPVFIFLHARCFTYVRASSAVTQQGLKVVALHAGQLQ